MDDDSLSSQYGRTSTVDMSSFFTLWLIHPIKCVCTVASRVMNWKLANNYLWSRQKVLCMTSFVVCIYCCLSIYILLNAYLYFMRWNWSFQSSIQSILYYSHFLICSSVSVCNYFQLFQAFSFPYHFCWNGDHLVTFLLSAFSPHHLVWENLSIFESVILIMWINISNTSLQCNKGIANLLENSLHSGLMSCLPSLLSLSLADHMLHFH